MKNALMFVSVLLLLSVLIGCEENIIEEPVDMVVFDYEGVEPVEEETNSEITLPFVENDNGFLLGWEDEDGRLYQETYVLNGNVTLTPVFEMFDDVLELTFNEKERSVQINRYDGEAPYVKLPNTINGYYVRSIGENAFIGTEIERIELPKTIFYIDDKAFTEMPNLEVFHFYDTDLGFYYETLLNEFVNYIIDANDSCTLEGKSDRPTIDNPWVFEDGCPIAQIVGSNKSDIYPDRKFTYDVLLDLNYAENYIQEMPSLYMRANIFFKSENIKSIKFPSVRGPIAHVIQMENIEEVYLDFHEALYSDKGILYLKSNDELYHYPSGLCDTTTIIPEHITHLNSNWAITCTIVETLVLHDNITFVPGAFFYLVNLETITVDENHPTMMDIEGIVFSKDVTQLIAYPLGKKDTTYTTPEGTLVIGERAFEKQGYIEHLVFSEGVETIESFAIWFMRSVVTLDLASSIDSVPNDGLWCIRCVDELIIRNTDMKLEFFGVRDLEMFDEPFTIYVPDHLLDEYREDAMWQQYYAGHFKPLSELDES